MTTVSERFREHAEWAEGFRLTVYDDATGASIVPGSKVIGHPTIGYGTRCDIPIPLDAAEMMFDRRADAVMRHCEEMPYWQSLSAVRKVVVMDMVYNVGVHGWRGFVMTNRALERGDWKAAAEHMADSRWFEQVGRRAHLNCWMMQTGAWPGDYERTEADRQRLFPPQPAGGNHRSPE